MRRLIAFLCLLVLFPAAANAQSNVHARLDAALNEYNAAVEEGIEVIAEALNDSFKKAQQSGNVLLAQKIQAAQTQLRKDGELPANLALTARETAQRNIAIAARNLRTKYEEVSNDLLRQGDVQGAADVSAEAKQFIGPKARFQPRKHTPAVQLRFPALVIRNSIGIELKLLPAGTFIMGEAGGESDENPHQVTLTKPFYLGIYEVTNAQWKQVMGNAPSRSTDDNHPVEQVSWEDAVMFCQKLSDRQEERQAGRVYRLPTEAEWEYACRSGTNTRYSYGDDESQLGDHAWFVGNADGATHSVGKKKANGWGLYDMHGNVFEWCSDWHDKYPTGAVTNPQGPAATPFRVCRGGYWEGAARLCRSANRNRNVPSFRDLFTGFRLALSLPGAELPSEAPPGK